MKFNLKFIYILFFTKFLPFLIKKKNYNFIEIVLLVQYVIELIFLIEQILVAYRLVNQKFVAKFKLIHIKIGNFKQFALNNQILYLYYVIEYLNNQCIQQKNGKILLMMKLRYY